MLIFAPRQKGMTLIEVLISLVAGTILLASLLALFINTAKTASDVLQMTRLNHELRTVMALMSEDIRRAGYWSKASKDLGTGASTNPFMSSSTDIQINASGNCILLSYDLKKDGVLPAIGTSTGDDRFGYRLLNSAVQSRIPGNNYNCNASANTWTELTDPNVVKITALTFTQTTSSIDLDGSGSGTTTIVIRNITISITGQLTDDSKVTKTLTETVRVRNDKYVL